MERVTAVNNRVCKVFGGRGGCIQHTVRGILDPRANENANRAFWETIDKQCPSELVFRLGDALGSWNGDLSRISPDPPGRHRHAVCPKSGVIPRPWRRDDGESFSVEADAWGVPREDL